jgi:formate/nitrite transporter FocA (FNT family)
MKHGPEINIFVLKMMTKSDLEQKNILKFLHVQNLFFGGFLHQIANSVIAMTFALIKLFVEYRHIINECLSYKFHPYSILTR